MAHGRLTPDFKTIADFRRDNGKGIRNVCRSFMLLCRKMKLFSQAEVAIDGSKFKAVNSRDRNFSPGKIDARKEQIEQSIQRYLDALETADRVQPAELEAKTDRLQEKIVKLRDRILQRRTIEAERRQQVAPSGCGYCQNCTAVLPLAAHSCSACDAQFSGGAAWKVQQSRGVDA